MGLEGGGRVRQRKRSRRATLASRRTRRIARIAQIPRCAKERLLGMTIELWGRWVMAVASSLVLLQEFGRRDAFGFYRLLVRGAALVVDSYCGFEFFLTFCLASQV